MRTAIAASFPSARQGCSEQHWKADHRCCQHFHAQEKCMNCPANDGGTVDGAIATPNMPHTPVITNVFLDPALQVGFRVRSFLVLSFRGTHLGLA